MGNDILDNHEFYDSTNSYDVRDDLIIMMTANHDVTLLSREDLLILIEALDAE